MVYQNRAKKLPFDAYTFHTGNTKMTLSQRHTWVNLVAVLRLSILLSLSVHHPGFDSHSLPFNPIGHCYGRKEIVCI